MLRLLIGVILGWLAHVHFAEQIASVFIRVTSGISV